MGAHQIREALVGEGKVHHDAVATDPSPALGHVPQREQEPVIDPLVMGDGQRHRELVGAPDAPAEELDPELWPRHHAGHEAVVEHGQAGGLEDRPAHLRSDVRAVVVPAPWPQHVSGADQLDTAPAEHVDLAGEQAVHDQKSPVMDVGLHRRPGIPGPGGEPPHASQGIAPGPIASGTVEQRREVVVGVDDAHDVRGTGHRRHLDTPRSCRASLRRSRQDVGMRTARQHPRRGPV